MPDLRVATARDLTSARIDRNVVSSSCPKRDLLNMTLDAHSLSWCTRRQFFYNHPEKITEVYYAEMAETFKTVTGAAYVHVFHHELCADRHNADGNGFNTSPALAASFVARSIFVFVPCCEAPSGHRQCLLPLVPRH